MENTLGYLCYFYYYALRGIFRKQDLRFPTVPSHFQTDFLLTKSLADKWTTLFKVDPDNNTIPFTYYWLEYEKFYLKTMDALRFNFRNVLHLGHAIVFLRESNSIRVGETVRLMVSIQDIVWLDRDRALFLIESMIKDSQGTDIIKSTDTIFLKGLSDSNVNELQHSTLYNHTDVSAFRNLTKRKPMLSGENIQIGSIFIPENFGSHYGRVSGDRNPVHTGEWLAKLFGYPRPFIQGSATLNFLFKYFIGERAEQIKALNLKFCRPIYMNQTYMNQTIQVRHSIDAFELVDANANLLAFGARE